MSNHDPKAGLTNAQLDAYWMPFTGNRQFKKDPRIITGAAGKHYFSADNRKIFDGLSGLWTCGLGHGRQEIADAIHKQASSLDYSPAFQFGHRGAFQLAERITSFMPEGLNRVFFTNSGSDISLPGSRYADTFSIISLWPRISCTRWMRSATY